MAIDQYQEIFSFEKALKVIRPVYLNQSTIPTFYIVNVGGGYLRMEIVTV